MRGEQCVNCGKRQAKKIGRGAFVLFLLTPSVYIKHPIVEESRCSVMFRKSSNTHVMI